MPDLSPTPSPTLFPVVGIGASAGGLEAFTQLLQRLPPDTGFGFVLIQHLDRTHPSFLREALAKATAMPVHQAEHGLRVESGHVYVIAPNTDLALHAGQLRESPRPRDGPTSHLPVDFFLRSLAAELGSRAIGVVLSGSASDGTEGLRAIREGDGITLAQDPRSARFPGMPQSAIDAGVVDYCMDIPALADELVRLSSHPYVRRREPEVQDIEAPGSAGDPALEVRAPESEQEVAVGVREAIFARVRDAVGLDFSEFKPSTVARRLLRRLAVRRIADLPAYLALLEAEPAEVRALYEDMLIHVTSFFRDPEVFALLHTQVFPEILQHKAEGATARVWVAGCSTGEEVYSMAIAWLEYVEQLSLPHPIQIFGSDVSEVSVQKARAGVYSEAAMRGVSAERRERYFHRVDQGYCVNKNLRDQCVFVRHDLVRDPPFSKLDLVSCRNVLIYFDQALQRKVVPTLHYCLNQPGFLVLGRSENISGFTQLFSSVDKANKIFKRTSATSRLRFAPRVDMTPLSGRVAERVGAALPEHADSFTKQLDRLLLARYAPPGVLVRENMDVLLFRGRTGAYLEAASGAPQNNLIGMARGGLVSALRTTIAQAKEERVAVRCAGVEIDQGGSIKRCDVVAFPFSGLPDNAERLFVVLFEESGNVMNNVPELQGAPNAAADASVSAREQEPEGRHRARLEHELSSTKEYMHTLLEEHGRVNDELGTSNEELISGNEELQSMNEELETAKEELQSVNEELTTLNDELQRRNHEVEQLASKADDARAEAERANTAKDDFLATLSHELRTPMSSILLNAQRLRSGDVVEREDLKRAGEALERATRLQVGLIDDLLDVSRIGAGKLALALSPVDLCEVVRVSLENVSASFETKSLALVVSLDVTVGSIWGDRMRVQQVVANLLSNALKFTPTGGRVSVTVDALVGFARLCVSDTGIGIETSFLPHMFARFSQRDSSITRKYGGLGLGLALVHDLVTLQGGTVHAESKGTGQGAAFTLTFPLALASQLPVAELAAAAPATQALDRPGRTRQYPALAGLRVLFVDDDQRTREAVLEVLQLTGAVIELAASAAEGAAKVETFKPQVILCDIAMPGEDGYSFMRKLRTREAGRASTIPALALTALASEADRQRALAAGFQLHLAKPIDIDRLREAVLELSLLAAGAGVALA